MKIHLTPTPYSTSQFWSPLKKQIIHTKVPQIKYTHQKLNTKENFYKFLPYQFYEDYKHNIYSAATVLSSQNCQLRMRLDAPN